MLRTTAIGSWPPAQRSQVSARAFSARRRTTVTPSRSSPKSPLWASRNSTHGLNEHTGGETSADSACPVVRGGTWVILHFPRFLKGIAPTDQREAWDGRGSYTCQSAARLAQWCSGQSGGASHADWAVL